SDGHLVFLKDRRKTSQDFLEDIRRMRNAVAHNKSLSAAQLQLLNLYFEDLTTPLQGAFDRGDSQVNPDDYLEATPAELASYFKDLQEDVLDIKDDIADLQDALGATEEKVRGLQGGVLTIVSSILVFGVFLVLHLKDWNAMAATAGPETIEWLTQRSQRGNHVAGLLFGIGVIRLVLGRLGVSLPGPLLVSIVAKILPPLRPIEERLAGPAGFVFLLAFAGAGFVYWDSGSLSLAILAGLAALL
ncbi:MAG: STY4199 family HEPN domain-containing protein, partial [Myxococcota bacterium]|nr:STY4199 family HEPN domain-containing protein [Myxococcota bacterium]